MWFRYGLCPCVRAWVTRLKNVHTHTDVYAQMAYIQHEGYNKEKIFRRTVTKIMCFGASVPYVTYLLMYFFICLRGVLLMMIETET